MTALPGAPGCGPRLNQAGLVGPVGEAMVRSGARPTCSIEAVRWSLGMEMRIGLPGVGGGGVAVAVEAVLWAECDVNARMTNTASKSRGTPVGIAWFFLNPAGISG